MSPQWTGWRWKIYISNTDQEEEEAEEEEEEEEGRDRDKVASTVLCEALQLLLLLLLLLFYNINIYFLPHREHFICSSKKNRLKLFIIRTIQNKKVRCLSEVKVLKYYSQW